AAARAAASRRSGASLIAVVRVRRALRSGVRADAAQIGEVTEVARSGRGIDLRLTGQKRAGEPLDHVTTAALLFAPVSGCARSVRDRPDTGQELCARRDTHEA